MEKKEFKVGEVFQCGLVKLIVKNGIKSKCNGCVFCEKENCNSIRFLVGDCDSRFREDKTDVIFKKVEE